MELDDETRRELGCASAPDAITGPAARYMRMQDLVFENAARLRLINETYATLAWARWGHPFESRLSMDRIGELTGRAKSTVDEELERIAFILEALDAHPHLPISFSYGACRRYFSVDESLFLACLDVVASPRRAAELSGHGASCAAATRNRLLRRLSAVATRDCEVAAVLFSILKLHTALAGKSTLGKRRHGVMPRTPAPISWLDQPSNVVVTNDDYDARLDRTLLDEIAAFDTVMRVMAA